MAKLLVELIGTFFLVFTIGMTVYEAPASVMPPLAIAAVLVGIIYAGGPVSGAHYNPAVTVAFWVRGSFGGGLVVPYIAAQLVGAALAAAAVLYLQGVSAIPGDLATGPALLAEFLFTFALVWTILQVATTKAAAGNGYYGLAIASIVLAGAFAVGEVSGAAFNPAVAVAVSIMGLSGWENLWVFLVANLAGGLAAAGAFRVINPGEFSPAAENH